MKANPAYTSQRCPACGIADRKSRQSQADFWCRSCGCAANADVNAARNIRQAAGHAASAREGPQDAGPVHREPQPMRLRPRACRSSPSVGDLSAYRPGDSHAGAENVPAPGRRPCGRPGC
ncbi:zinc ribbon domain-containing protein [Streptosporangium sp. NPDC000396]|uniref:zinc ribbon domain-containing protein n=1 Tax=Streptosporangium sp. NPDC000396 TaxID=3366185 RepID=UPI0036A12A5B